MDGASLWLLQQVGAVYPFVLKVVTILLLFVSIVIQNCNGWKPHFAAEYCLLSALYLS
jgi:hypothetical protein